MKLVFATNNSHKLQEVREILGDRFSIASLAEIGCHDDIPENGKTIEENARAKTDYIVEHYGLSCFADDTGLEVDVLGGEPGVHSARYAEGTDHDSKANTAKLLRKLGDSTDRRARFRTVISLAEKQEDGSWLRHTFEGKVEGRIALEPRGTEGFGYDPVFVPDGYDKSFAELGEDVKNHISHRARAVAKLTEYLKGKE